MLCGGMLWDPKHDLEQQESLNATTQSSCQLGFEKVGSSVENIYILRTMEKYSSFTMISRSKPYFTILIPWFTIILVFSLWFTRIL